MALLKGLLPNRDITRLLAAQVASQMGDAAFLVLLLWVVAERTGSGAQVGAAAAVTTAPILAFGMVGGLAADRFAKRRILISSDLWRACVALSLPILGAAGLRSTIFLALSGFLLATASAFFNPARDAFVPSLAKGGDLVGANASLQLSVPVGYLLGPSLAALLLRWYSAESLFAGVGVLFLVSVAFLLGLPRGEPEAGRREASTRVEFFAGLRLAWRDPRLRWLLAITAVDNLFIMGPATVGTPIFVREVLHRGDQVYALSESMYAVGMLLGLPLSLWLGRRFGLGKVLIAAIFIDGITYLPFLWLKSPAAMMAVIVAHGVAIPMITVTRSTLVQRITPGESLGRVFALISITVIGLTAVSSALTGLVSEVVSMPVLFAIIAVGASLCAPAAWTSRAFREA